MHSAVNGLATAVGDAALAKVIRCQFHSHAIARQDTNIVLAHLSRDMGRNDVAIFEFDAKCCVGQGLCDHAFHL